jgi:predicted PurR-regulated permease PerM
MNTFDIILSYQFPMKFFSSLSLWIKNLFADLQYKKNIVLWSEIKPNKKISSETIPTPTIGTFSAGQITLFWTIGVGVVYIAYLAFQSLDLLYLILAAVLISVAMESLIQVGARRMPRWLSIGLNYLLLILFMLTGVIIILPFILQQLSSIIGIVITYFYDMGQNINMLWLSGYIESLIWVPTFIKSYILDALRYDTMNIQSTLINNISSLVSTGSDYAKNLWWIALDFVGSFFSVLWQVGLVLTISVLFSLEKESIVRFFVYYTTKNITQVEYMSQKIDLFYTKMWLWLKAQLWLCVMIAVIVYISLLILSLFGMPLPNMWALALMAWFTEFIPYIWPILWAIPAVIVAGSVYGIKWFLIVAALYFIIQWLENNVLIPLLMNKSLGVSPLLIFLCVLIWGSVLWFIGILLAVPISVLVTMIVKKDFE